MIPIKSSQWKDFCFEDVQVGEDKFSMSEDGSKLARLKSVPGQSSVLSVWIPGHITPLYQMQLESTLSDCDWLNDEVILLGGFGNSMRMLRIHECEGYSEDIALNFDESNDEAIRWVLLVPKAEVNVAYALQEGHEIVRVEFDDERRTGSIRRRWVLGSVRDKSEETEADEESQWIVTDRMLFSLSRKHGLIVRSLDSSSEEAIVVLCLNSLKWMDELHVENTGLSVAVTKKLDGSCQYVELDLYPLLFQTNPDVIRKHGRIIQSQVEEAWLSRSDVASDHLQIGNSDLWVSVITGQLMCMAHSREEAIEHAILRGDASELCIVNGWETSLVPAITFDYSLRKKDAGSACNSLTSLVSRLTELSNDVWIRLCGSVDAHVAYLALQDELYLKVVRLLIEGIRMMPNEAITSIMSATLTKLRSKRLQIERLNPGVFDQGPHPGSEGPVDVSLEHVLLVSSRSSEGLQTATSYQAEAGWMFEATADSSSFARNENHVDLNMQRIRNALSWTGLWNRWMTMTDSQVTVSAVDSGKVASACAFIRARLEGEPQQNANESPDAPSPSMNTFEYLQRLVCKRALQLLCDFDSANQCLVRVNLDPFRFYQSVALGTFSRTLRKSVLRHIRHCLRKPIGDDENEAIPLPGDDGLQTEVSPDSVLVAEGFIKEMEHDYPCKSYAVALKRGWSSRFSTDAAEMIIEESLCLSELDSCALLALKLSPPRSDARDGDDERCQDLSCSTCLLQLESTETASLDFANGDPFTRFFRFSLRSILRSDEATRLRIRMEATGQRSAQSARNIELKYLLDHNDWRGLEEWLLSCEQEGMTLDPIALVRESLTAASPFTQSLLSRFLLLRDDSFQASKDDLLIKFGLSRLHVDSSKNIPATDLALLKDLNERGLVDAIDILLDELDDESLLTLGKTLLTTYDARDNGHFCIALIRERLRRFPEFQGTGTLVQLLMDSTGVSSLMELLNMLGPLGNRYQLSLLSLVEQHELDSLQIPRKTSSLKQDWLQWAKQAAQAWPEMLAAFPRTTPTAVVSEANEPLSEGEWAQVEALVTRYGGAMMSDSLALGCAPQRNEDETQLMSNSVVLGPEYFLRNNRPLAALESFVRTGFAGMDAAVIIARSVALVRPHDGMIVETCCRFLDLYVEYSLASTEMEAATTAQMNEKDELKDDILESTPEALASNALATAQMNEKDELKDDVKEIGTSNETSEKHELKDDVKVLGIVVAVPDENDKNELKDDGDAEVIQAEIDELKVSRVSNEMNELNDDGSTSGRELKTAIERQKLALRVDALVLSTILARSDEHLDVGQLVVSLGLLQQEDGSSEATTGMIEVFRMLQSSIATSSLDGGNNNTEDREEEKFILGLLAAFCSVHSLPPSLALLDRLSRSVKDLFALLSAADQQNVPLDLFKRFVKGCSLPRSVQTLLLLSMSSNDDDDQDETMTALVGQELLLVKTLLGPTPYESLLRISEERYLPYMAAIASLFPDRDLVRVWTAFLIAALHLPPTRLVPSASEETRLLQAVSFGIRRLPGSAKVLSESAKAFQSVFPLLAKFIRFRCGRSERSAKRAETQEEDAGEEDDDDDEMDQEGYLVDCFLDERIGNFVLDQCNQWLFHSPTTTRRSDGDSNEEREGSVLNWMDALERFLYATHGLEHATDQCRGLVLRCRSLLSRLQFLNEYCQWGDSRIVDFIGRFLKGNRNEHPHDDDEQFITALTDLKLFALAYDYLRQIDQTLPTTWLKEKMKTSIACKEVMELFINLTKMESVEAFALGLDVCLERLTAKQVPRETAMIVLFRPWRLMISNTSKRTMLTSKCTSWMLSTRDPPSDNDDEGIRLLAQLGEELNIDMSFEVFMVEESGEEEMIEQRTANKNLIVNELLGRRFDLAQALTVSKLLRKSAKGDQAVQTCSQAFEMAQNGKLVETIDSSLLPGAQTFLRYLSAATLIAQKLSIPLAMCSIPSEEILTRVQHVEDHRDWLLHDQTALYYMKRLTARLRDTGHARTLRGFLEMYLEMLNAPRTSLSATRKTLEEALDVLFDQDFVAARRFAFDLFRDRNDGNLIRIKFALESARYSRSRQRCKEAKESLRRFCSGEDGSSFQSMLDLLFSLEDLTDLGGDSTLLVVMLKRLVESKGDRDWLGEFLSMVQSTPSLIHLFQYFIQSSIFSHPHNREQGLPFAVTFFDQVRIGTVFKLDAEVARVLEHRGESMLSLVRQDEATLGGLTNGLVDVDRLNVIKQCLLESLERYEAIKDDDALNRVRTMLENIQARIESILSV